MELRETKFPIELKENPYLYIRRFYENAYPCIGAKVMSILSLVPISLAIPKIPSGIKETKQRLNLLLLSPSGSGKTSLAKEFEKITIDPISTQKITPARLAYEVRYRGEKPFSLIVYDVAVMFENEETIKLLEGILGEESEILRDTMHNKNNKDSKKKNGCAFLAGTPSNLSDRKIRNGLLGRTSPLLLYFTKKENEKIIKRINSRIGKPVENEEVNHIHKYYQSFFDMQDGKGEYNPILGYVISEEIKKEVEKFILNLPLLNHILDRYGVTGARTAEQMYKFMIAHCCLNFLNRKIIDGKIVVQEEDLEIAKKLTDRDVKENFKIMMAIEKIDYENIKNEKEFRNWDLQMRRNKSNFPQSIKILMKDIVKR